MREDGGIRSGAIRRSLERLERLPRGIVSYFPRLSSPVTVGTSATAVTGNLPFEFEKGRRFRIVVYVRAIASGAGECVLFLMDGGSNLNATYGSGNPRAHAAGGLSLGYVEWHVNGTGQRHTALNIKGQGAVSGSWFVDAPSQFYIEDVGAL